MSQLPKAPLLEVILELTWQSNSEAELNKYQLMVGALCSKLSERYDTPQFLLPDPNMPIVLALGKPVYRCHRKDNPSQIFQVGPGLLSVNLVGNQYDWDSFLPEVMEVVKALNSEYDFNDQQGLGVNLKYVDFFPYDFTTKSDITQFINENFHIQIQADFFDDIKELGFRVGFATKAGIFRMVINSAQITETKKLGIIIESQLNNLVPVNDHERFKEVICNSHEYLSDFFKKLTAGKLYESFK